MQIPFRLLLIPFLLTASASMAEQSHPSGETVVTHIFARADLDDDGVLTPDEYEGAGLVEFGVRFEECDLDQDGLLTANEYLRFYEAHHPPADDVEL